MSNPFDIAAANSPLAGSSALAGTPDGLNSSAEQAPEGLFSTMLNLLNGGDGATSSSNTTDLNQTPNWLEQNLTDPNLSLTAQALQAVQESADSGLPDAALADQTNIGPALLGLLGQTAPGTPTAAAETTAQASGNVPLPAPLLSARQNLLAGLGNVDADSDVPLKTAEQVTSNGAKPADLPGKPPGGPGLEFVASQATRTDLNATGLKTDLIPLALQTQPATDLAAALQRQFSPGGGAPKLAADLQKQAIGPDMAANIRVNGLVAAPVLAAQAELSTLPQIQSKLLGSTTDPLLAAQTLGQSASTLGQSLLTTGTPASFTSALQNVYQQAQINLPNMAFEIARNFAAGSNRFQIRMDPPELGRIDVRLNIDDGGELRARLTVERPETLDLLQRDARALERALQQAGFDTSNTNLEFSLQQNPFADSSQNDEQNPQNPTPQPDTDPLAGGQPEIAAAAYRGTAIPGGLNVWV